MSYKKKQVALTSDRAEFRPKKQMGAMSEETEALGQQASASLKDMIGGDKGVKLKEFAAMGLAAWLFGARTKRKWGLEEACAHWEREGKEKADPAASR